MFPFILGGLSPAVAHAFALFHVAVTHGALHARDFQTAFSNKPPSDAIATALGTMSEWQETVPHLQRRGEASLRLFGNRTLSSEPST